MRLTDYIPAILFGAMVGYVVFLFAWTRALRREQDLLRQKRALLNEMERLETQRRALNAAMDMAQGQYTFYAEPLPGDLRIDGYGVGKN